MHASNYTFELQKSHYGTFVGIGYLKLIFLLITYDVYYFIGPAALDQLP